VALAGAAPHGTARIMLRPEQLRLKEMALTSAAEGGGPCGVVTGIDFGGHGTLVTVKLHAPGPADTRGPGGPQTLCVRCSSDRIPARGATVRITVRGAAHVLRQC
jgi:hypothetical protein